MTALGYDYPQKQILPFQAAFSFVSVLRIQIDQQSIHTGLKTGSCQYQQHRKFPVFQQ